MSETRFTPGPWEAGEFSSIVGVPITAQPDKSKNTILLGSVCGARQFDGQRDSVNAEIKANARMSASAPELYAALKDVVERMECWFVGADIPVDLDKAIAALAKAVQP